MVDLSPYMLNDEVANLHVKRNRLVVASCLDIEDVIMCGNNYFFHSSSSPPFRYRRYQLTLVYSIDFIPKTHHFPLIKKRKTHHFMACSVTRAACRDDVEWGDGCR